MINIRQEENPLLSRAFFNEAIAHAFERNRALEDVDRGRLYRFVNQAVSEIALLEELARTRPLRIPETAEDLERIKVIWDVSGVGTYLKPYQNDRWKEVHWIGGTDRKRLNYTAALARRLTEARVGRSYKVPLGEKLITKQSEEVRENIKRFGPTIIYGSTKEQNDDIKEALEMPGVIIPSSKVHIVDFPGKPEGVNTLDQVKGFSFPPNLYLQDGDIMAIVAHAPHMVRLLHMLNKFRPFPDGLVIQPHPLQSLPFAGTEYAKMEISGLLYNTLILGVSTEEPYPYLI